MAPGPRRPKLRGAIQELDSGAREIVLFGRKIVVEKNAEFVDAEDRAGQLLEKIEEHQFIEYAEQTAANGRAALRRTLPALDSSQQPTAAKRQKIDATSEDQQSTSTTPSTIGTK